jgi:hypothetical protein
MLARAALMPCAQQSQLRKDRKNQQLNARSREFITTNLQIATSPFMAGGEGADKKWRGCDGHFSGFNFEVSAD